MFSLFRLDLNYLKKWVKIGSEVIAVSRYVKIAFFAEML